MRRASVASLALLLASGASLPALAGPVSSVARGVENKQETHDSDSDSSTRTESHDSGHSEDSDDDDATCTSCGSVVLLGGDDTSGSVTEDSGPGLVLEGPARFDAYLGAHAVQGSDGAASLDLRVHRDFLGLSAQGTSYFEQISDKGRTDTVRLDVWSLSPAGRLARAGSTEVWIEGGLGATTSTEYEGVYGVQVALRAQHLITPDLELFGRARFHGMQHDISAFEAWGGVRAWFLAAGYRSLQFNFGPPLHGPEAGVVLSF